METENSKAQLRKGVLEFCVLALLRKQGEAYPSDLLTALKSADLLVVEGTLYPLLTRLKNDKLLTYRWEESKSGPPRKYYALTDLGSKHLDTLVLAWKELTQAVEQIIQDNPPL